MRRRWNGRCPIPTAWESSWAIPEAIENELLEYVAVESMEVRRLEDPRSGDANDKPLGEPFEEETVDASFPRLALAFGFSD